MAVQVQVTHMFQLGLSSCLCGASCFGRTDQSLARAVQDACNVGDEGGFAPNIGSNEEGLNLVNQAIEVSCLAVSHFLTHKIEAGLQEQPLLA